MEALAFSLLMAMVQVTIENGELRVLIPGGSEALASVRTLLKPPANETPSQVSLLVTTDQTIANLSDTPRWHHKSLMLLQAQCLCKPDAGECLSGLQTSSADSSSSTHSISSP